MNRSKAQESPCQVRKASAQDMGQVASIHKQQFDDHFLGQYSVATLQRFYHTLATDTLFFVAESDGQVTGFVVGGPGEVLQERRGEFLRAHRRRLILETALRPSIWWQAATRAVGLARRGRDSSDRHPAGDVRLLSIAVAETAKGRGIAGRLVAAFEAGLPAGQSYGLSVHEVNERAIGFYRKVGFSEEARRNGLVYFRKTAGQNE